VLARLTGAGIRDSRLNAGAAYDFPIDINDDGTPDTTYAQLKKKGS
jgi:hypothetical protein